jgi:hypothetical protein
LSHSACPGSWVYYDEEWRKIGSLSGETKGEKEGRRVKHKERERERWRRGREKERVLK